MKIVSVIGARPQFVKEAVIQHEIRKRSGIQEVVIHTGQHYDENMSGSFFEVFQLREPDYNLNLHSMSHGEMTGRMLIELERLFLDEKPDGVIVYGDTNSTLAAALAASKIKVPVFHIEAGLRQEPRDMPEEINRVLTDRISEVLFCPCENAVQNLAKEGITRNVFFVGDVMYDVFLKQSPQFDESLIDELGLVPQEYVVMTLHRDFNVDDERTLSLILESVVAIAEEKDIVFPIHPRTRQRVREFGLENALENLHVTEPLDYFTLMGLTRHCDFAITDSGGYQKETYFSGKRALVVMPDTSWIELVEMGVNHLVNGENLYDTYRSMKETKFVEGIYGDGDAAKKIMDIIETKFSR